MWHAGAVLAVRRRSRSRRRRSAAGDLVAAARGVERLRPRWRVRRRSLALRVPVLLPAGLQSMRRRGRRWQPSVEGLHRLLRARCMREAGPEVRARARTRAARWLRPARRGRGGVARVAAVVRDAAKRWLALWSLLRRRIGPWHCRRVGAVRGVVVHSHRRRRVERRRRLLLLRRWVGRRAGGVRRQRHGARLRARRAGVRRTGLPRLLRRRVWLPRQCCDVSAVRTHITAQHSHTDSGPGCRRVAKRESGCGQRVEFEWMAATGAAALRRAARS
jgi:hypothetical protein